MSAGASHLAEPGRRRRLAAWALLGSAGIASLGALGCAPEFNEAAELVSLRVMAVQKDHPYAKPGEEVKLSMLYHDGRPGPAQPLDVRWLGGCRNPPGDAYQGCFLQLFGGASGAGGSPGADAGAALAGDAGAEAGSAGGGAGGSAGGSAGAGGGLPPGFDPATVDPSTLDQGTLDSLLPYITSTGDRFTLKVPADIISSRPPPRDANEPPYGLSYVFFTLCSGTLHFAPREEWKSFPFACYDDAGTRVGASGFVAGYTAIYSFLDHTNTNPRVTGFEVKGKALTVDCIGDTCLDVPAAESAAAAPLECDLSEPLCVAVCTKEKTEDCPKIPIDLLVDPASIDRDSVVKAREGTDVYEQGWVKYYTDRGRTSDPVRLLSDATTGFKADHADVVYAPKAPGPFHVWGVAQDNRGGVDWARITMVAR